MPSSLLSSPMRSPRPSPRRSNRLRIKRLRYLYENIKALRNNINRETVKKLEPPMKEVDSINKKRSLVQQEKNQQVVLLDSEILPVSSDILQKCTFFVNSSISRYDSHEFCNKIKSFVCKIPDTVSVVNDEPNWSLLGNEVMQYFKKPAKFSIVLGIFQLTPKKEIMRRKIVKEAQAPIKRPENVKTLDQVEDNITTAIVKIQKIVNHYQKQNKKPLDFFSLVLHPTDFGKTVENILHVSFFIRDGLLKFTLDNDGVPQVKKTNHNERSERNVNKKKNNIQNTLSLTMKQWRDLVKVYNIQKPMIDIFIS